jgi:hypothetical protein
MAPDFFRRRRAEDQVHRQTAISWMLDPQRVSKYKVVAKNNLHISAELILQIRSRALEISSYFVSNFRIVRLSGEQYIFQTIHTKVLVRRKREGVFLKIAYNPDSPNKGLSKFFESYLGQVAGEKMWQRNDGAILWLLSKSLSALNFPRR